MIKAAKIPAWKTQIILTWVVLLGLTALSPMLMKQSGGRHAALVLVLGIAFLKFQGIARVFMELKFAHPAWRVALSALPALVLTICYLVLRGAGG